MSEKEETETPPQKLEKPKNVVQWQVDSNYKKEQERLKIPTDPKNW